MTPGAALESNTVVENHPKKSMPTLGANRQLELRCRLLFGCDQLNQATTQLFAGDLDVVALAGLEQRSLATNQFADTLLQQRRQAERTTDLLDELLGEALFHRDLAGSEVRLGQIWAGREWLRPFGGRESYGRAPFGSTCGAARALDWRGSQRKRRPDRGSVTGTRPPKGKPHSPA